MDHFYKIYYGPREDFKPVGLPKYPLYNFFFFNNIEGNLSSISESPGDSWGMAERK